MPVFRPVYSSPVLIHISKIIQVSLGTISHEKLSLISNNNNNHNKNYPDYSECRFFRTLLNLVWLYSLVMVCECNAKYA